LVWLGPVGIGGRLWLWGRGRGGNVATQSGVGAMGPLGERDGAGAAPGFAVGVVPPPQRRPAWFCGRGGGGGGGVNLGFASEA